MTYKSAILPSAKEDLRKAAIWYNHLQPGLGKQLMKKFRERIAILRTNPLTCQIRYLEVHTALMEQFPYMIHYFVNKQDKSIVVISILHTSLNPKIWEERLK
jgi:hypothetical protein